jgi:hypothetical protein
MASDKGMNGSVFLSDVWKIMVILCTFLCTASQWETFHLHFDMWWWTNSMDQRPSWIVKSQSTSLETLRVLWNLKVHCHVHMSLLLVPYPVPNSSSLHFPVDFFMILLVEIQCPLGLGWYLDLARLICAFYFPSISRTVKRTGQYFYAVGASGGIFMS